MLEHNRPAYSVKKSEVNSAVWEHKSEVKLPWFSITV